MVEKLTVPSKYEVPSTSSLFEMRTSLVAEREWVVVEVPNRLYEADEKPAIWRVPKRPYEAEAVPWTSNLVAGEVVPMPTLPPLVRIILVVAASEEPVWKISEVVFTVAENVPSEIAAIEAPARIASEPSA